MRKLISNKTLWPLHVAQGRADEISAWVAANGINPADVSTEHPVTIEDTPNGRVIRCRCFMTNGYGVKVKPLDGGPDTQGLAVPLEVEPPEGWPVWALNEGESGA